jgi:hypothetical protein
VIVLILLLIASIVYPIVTARRNKRDAETNLVEA